MPFDEMAGQYSPDGAWMAVQGSANGRMEVYIKPLPVGAGPQQVSMSGGSQPRWAPDGKSLFYVAADGRMMVTGVKLAPVSGTAELTPSRALFQTQLARGFNVPPSSGTRTQYAVGPDGRFLLNNAVADAPAPPITVFVSVQAGVSR